MTSLEGKVAGHDANDGVNQQSQRPTSESAKNDGPLVVPPPPFEDYVSERLALLGLDGDTYAPYVLPLFGNDQDDPNLLEDEWETVLALLRDSAEVDDDGGDDDGIVATTGTNDRWTEFRKSLERAWTAQKEQDAESERRERELEQERAQVQIERERQLALAAASVTDAEDSKGLSKSGRALSKEEERERRALVERFAYENDDEEEDGLNNNGSNESEILTNRQAAALAAMEKQQQLRSKGPTTTKKEERQKTAQSRKEKEEKKEARRQRATKGERRR